MQSRRIQFTAFHFLLSCLVALVALTGVRFLWFPGPFFAIGGAVGLLIILVAVDVVLGPLLTFAVASPSKSLPTLRRDLISIALIQLAALGYGLKVVEAARPALMVYHDEAAHVFRAVDVRERIVTTTTLSGMRILYARPPISDAERSVDAAQVLEGKPSRVERADLYQEATAHQTEICRWPLLLEQYRDGKRKNALLKRLAEQGYTTNEYRYLRLFFLGREWVALYGPDCRMVDVVAGRLPRRRG